MKASMVGGFLGMGVVGLIAGVLVGDVLGADTRQQELEEMWALEPVIVYAQDADKGETVGFEVISQRDMPAQFVTPSVVRPERFREVVDRTLAVPVSAGDLVRITDLVPVPEDGAPEPEEKAADEGAPTDEAAAAR